MNNKEIYIKLIEIMSFIDPNKNIDLYGRMQDVLDLIWHERLSEEKIKELDNKFWGRDFKLQ